MNGIGTGMSAFMRKMWAGYIVMYVLYMLFFPITSSVLLFLVCQVLIGCIALFHEIQMNKLVKDNYRKVVKLECILLGLVRKNHE